MTPQTFWTYMIASIDTLGEDTRLAINEALPKTLFPDRASALAALEVERTEMEDPSEPDALEWEGDAAEDGIFLYYIWEIKTGDAAPNQGDQS